MRSSDLVDCCLCMHYDIVVHRVTLNKLLKEFPLLASAQSTAVVCQKCVLNFNYFAVNSIVKIGMGNTRNFDFDTRY